MLAQAVLSYDYQGLQVLLQELLASPHCADKYAEKLGEFLDRVNELVG